MIILNHDVIVNENTNSRIHSERGLGRLLIISFLACLARNEVPTGDTSLWSASGHQRRRWRTKPETFAECRIQIVSSLRFARTIDIEGWRDPLGRGPRTPWFPAKKRAVGKNETIREIFKRDSKFCKKEIEAFH